MRFTLFVDAELQRAYVAALKTRGALLTLRNDGAVMFSPAAPNPYVEAAHEVRDAQFPWYLLKPQDESQANAFRRLLSQAGLRFFVELHETGEWLLVPRADQEQHDRLTAQL